MDELTFNSLTLEDKDHLPTKPPLQPVSLSNNSNNTNGVNNNNSNLVDIGPFMISKLHIPEGFYSNPTTWSKSSTGSGHTEHEDDSYQRPEREHRYDHVDPSIYSPSYHPPSQSLGYSETDDLLHNNNSQNNPFRLGGGIGTRMAYENENNNQLDFTFPPRTTSHIQEKLHHQMQMQKKLMQAQVSSQSDSAYTSQSRLLHAYTPNHASNTIPNLPPPTNNHLFSNKSPYAHDHLEQPEPYSARPAISHYSPSGNISPTNAGWRSQQGTPTSAGTPTSLGSPFNHLRNSGQKLPIPPMSPASAYHSPYAQASQNGVNGLIYQVQFKCTVRHYGLGSQAHPSIMIGDFVVVEADRGEDIGVIVEILPMKTFVERRIYMKASVDDENVIGRILRLASVAERQFLPEKFHDEENIVQFCRELGYSTYRLPMLIHDVEYQFDRHKLTIYYSSDARVDFREFVRDLFSAYKARIWMKKVVSNKPVRIENWASVALATGMQFTPDNK